MFSTAVTQDIKLTSRARERLELLREKKRDDQRKLRLRLGVEGGGCSGYQYVFKLTQDAPDDDVDFLVDDDLIVDDESLDLVRGSKIDFVEDLIRRAFEVVDNPNAESGCGCGASFSQKTDSLY